MYQKPDFVKVSVKVKDVFANYSGTSCPMDEGTVNLLVASPCYVITVPDTTYVAQGWGIGCYSTNNP
jgi:hypothetical protein